MNFISKWFWKRAVRHEMASIAKTVAQVAGVVLIIAAVIGAAPLVLGLILGLGAILLAGWLKHRLLAAGALLVGLLLLGTFGGLAAGGAFLIVIASGLGLASSFV